MRGSRALGYDGADAAVVSYRVGTTMLALESTTVLRKFANPWMLAAAGVVAVVMAPVLFGLAPLSGDPEQMYQPFKTELARALANGRLPFWSDRFGLGVPLVAESHVAAFYPLNPVIYRLLEVGTAYRLSLWLHSVAIAVATFAYARTLGIASAGSALAALAFALCGFQAIHVVHEPFYHAVPFLLLCLILADRYAATGRIGWLAGLALAWGCQVTLGHFQIPMWTAGLVLLAGGWRVLGMGDRPRWRLLGLAVGLIWGAAIAWVQLRLTWELVGVAGFVRPAVFLSNYMLPPRQLAQFALPEVYLGRPEAPEEFWRHRATTPGEACVYIGIIPLILAVVGLAAAPRDRALRPWLLVAPLALALATMPGWWPEAFYYVLKVPGLGWFRAPARYTMLASLGLILLAARGLDLGRSMGARRFWIAMALALAVGALATLASVDLIGDAEYRAALGRDTIAARFALAGLTWLLGLAAIAAWRLGWLGAWAPLAVATVELVGLFFVGPTPWYREATLPDSSPALLRLIREPGVGLVGGRLLNIPARVGLTAAFPAMGITPPPPNYLLEAVMRPPGRNTAIEDHWLRRFGVTHGVWGRGEDTRGTRLLAVVNDPVLDRLTASMAKEEIHGPWKLVHYPSAFPPAWVALRVHEAKVWGQLYTELSIADAPDDAWFVAEDGVPKMAGPAANTAAVKSWDGRSAVVDHDGSCVLILRRATYPGWTYRIDGGPWQPVWKVDGGLQGIPLSGSGTSRVETAYHPTGLRNAAMVSVVATLGALVMLGVSAVVNWRFYRGVRAGKTSECR